MKISQQLDDLGRVLAKLGGEHIVAPIQREELIEILNSDLADGCRRAAREVRKLEDAIGGGANA